MQNKSLFFSSALPWCCVALYPKRHFSCLAVITIGAWEVTQAHKQFAPSWEGRARRMEGGGSASLETAETDLVIDLLMPVLQFCASVLLPQTESRQLVLEHVWDLKTTAAITVEQAEAGWAFKAKSVTRVNTLGNTVVVVFFFLRKALVR